MDKGLLEKAAAPLNRTNFASEAPLEEPELLGAFLITLQLFSKDLLCRPLHVRTLEALINPCNKYERVSVDKSETVRAMLDVFPPLDWMGESKLSKHGHLSPFTKLNTHYRWR